MPEYKLVIGTKDGKSVQKIIPEADSKIFLDKKIGEIIKGESLNFTGWEFKITGGSDKAGFPMRSDVPGMGRKKILTVKGIGVNNKKKYRGKDKKGKRSMKGMRTRKTVAGNTISRETAQINVKAVTEGTTPLGPSEKSEKKE
ncbi:30S ribosomal protein S6e [Candidatus Woesearchaeota archaeon]|nr:30S ribosomal protein S6e [Candidatus Woesearchaeota archaeon]